MVRRRMLFGSALTEPAALWRQTLTPERGIADCRRSSSDLPLRPTAEGNPYGPLHAASSTDDISATLESPHMSDADQFPTDSTAPADGAVLDDAGAIAGAESADVQRELDEQRDKYLRLAAEYDNFRKRTARERQEAHCAARRTC